MFRVTWLLLFVLPLTVWAKDLASSIPAAGVSSLDQATDTLRHDNNVPRFVFRYPDAFGDDYRNQRFQSPHDAILTGAFFVFPTRGGVQWTTGDPDLVTMVWQMGTDSLPDPDQVLVRDTLEYAAFSANIYALDSAWHDTAAQLIFVDLLDHALHLDSGAWFHLGYTALINSDDDSLAILSDEGIPETAWASEYYNGSFQLMSAGWLGVNFFIRALVESTEGVEILRPVPRQFELLSAYPNPFNAQTRIDYVVSHSGVVRLDVFDLAGRKLSSPVSEFQSAGNYSLHLSNDNWSSGSYWVRLSTGAERHVIKIILEK